MIEMRYAGQGDGETGMTAKLAIIGGGPKAVAIACKAKILTDARVLDCEVHVFEERAIGASWSGTNGYTDGLQALCTPAEKDLGFPYAAFPGVPEAAATMMSQFSWGAFKASRDYADWIDRGRAPESHAEFAAYLNWAFERGHAILHKRKVVGLKVANLPGKPVRKGWVVDSEDVPGGTSTSPSVVYDGVVVTGHGPARTLDSVAHTRLFDGKNFWDNQAHRIVRNLVRTQAITEDHPLVVIGSGGTAAAVMAWFVRQGFPDLPMILLAQQATFFTRGDSVFENRLFSDLTFWRELSHGTRKNFVDRLTRGVVWQTVMEDLIKLTALRFVEGRATKITSAAAGNLTVDWTRTLSGAEIKAGAPELGSTDAGIVVNATGFDNWWFLDKLPSGAIPTSKAGRARLLNRLTDGMGEDLTFRDGWRLPRLHAPFQSIMVGPGFSSLLALGDMADRVLRPYIPVSDLPLP